MKAGAKSKVAKAIKGQAHIRWGSDDVREIDDSEGSDGDSSEEERGAGAPGTRPRAGTPVMKPKQGDRDTVGRSDFPSPPLHVPGFVFKGAACCGGHAALALLGPISPCHSCVLRLFPAPARLFPVPARLFSVPSWVHAHGRLPCFPLVLFL
jgi:hypothetical protein